MDRRTVNLSILGCVFPLLILVAALAGCSTVEGNVGLGTGLFTLWGARTPAQEVEVTYYLGVLDPEDQIPPQMYRVRVHGQASLLSGMNFASAWVPAEVVDSLNPEFITRADNAMLKETYKTEESVSPAPVKTSTTDVSAGQNGATGKKDPCPCSDDTTPEKAKSETTIRTEESNVEVTKCLDLSLEMNRRMLLFGPEGFRVAPAKHRLVIVMGSSPDKYFDALRGALAEVKGSPDAAVKAGQQAQQEIVKRLLDEMTRAQREKTGLDELAKDAHIDIQPKKESK